MPVECNDPDACNYTEGDCMDGVCTYPGCMDAEACNYDPTAGCDGGNCDYTCYGCTDPTACNYDADATLDDDSCDYSCYGCTDPLATNYDADATIDDGSCAYDFEICDCDFNTFSPAVLSQLGNDVPNNTGGTNPNFNCEAWGYDCGDIAGAPDDDPYGVCDGGTPDDMLIATSTGCPLTLQEMESQGMFVLYPNPSNGEFVITNMGNESYFLLTIYDATGKKVFTQTYNLPQRSRVTVNAGMLSSGTYMVELGSSHYIEHHQLVITR
ncbi:MAG: T9SS type A sorting domain-containing protein [Flavobacteriales bacterium]|nr:T9SS type A sorting domain-containing protein [Flavobacteriales bacterium]